MIRHALVTLGLWLAGLGGWTPPICERAHAPDTPLLISARIWTAWAEETFPDTSGEHKRHQVYARLLRIYPDARRRDVALAIELALRVEEVL